MVRIIILGHNHLADELCSTAAMICGPMPEEMSSFNLLAGDSQESLLAQMEAIAKEHPHDEYLVLVDIYGGSCFQVACNFLQRHNGRILTGINLNTMLEAQLGASRGLALEELLEKIQAAAHKGIQVVADRIHDD